MKRFLAFKHKYCKFSTYASALLCCDPHEEAHGQSDDVQEEEEVVQDEEKYAHEDFVEKIAAFW